MSSPLQYVVFLPPPVPLKTNFLSGLTPFHPCRAFRNLTPRTHALVGLSLLAWGTIGLYLSDTAEKKFGFEPSEKEKQELEKVLPRITVVDREGGSKG